MKKILGIMLVLAVLIVVLIGFRLVKKVSYEALEKNDGFLEMQLQVLAQDLNPRLPRLVNNDLQLDEVRAGPGKRFSSFFTLLGYPLDTLNEEKRTSLAEDDTRTTCSSADLKSLFEAGVSIVHHYRSSDGHEAFTLTFTAQSCATSPSLP